MVGGAAAFGLGKRVASEEGGVVGFLCVPAVLTAERETLLDVLGGRWPEWLLVDYVRGSPGDIPLSMWRVADLRIAFRWFVSDPP